ncbi:MAG: Nitrilase/cyanide hydratase and apolipoprotein N-acyltransferase [Verrucomicrobiales bacterium]|nr:Nitrilase/cyanide hydratase and apolipoprotein N-acyltransferase [Verrucomicrobiales bacterium]
MKVLAIQFDIAWENKAENFARVHRLLANAKPTKDSLVVLPEMFATGFSMNAEAIAENYGGETEQFLARTAKEFQICLIGGVAMRGKSGAVRNKALIFSPDGQLLAFYAKMRPFTLGGEAEHYTAGLRPTIFDWQGVKVSPFICYDLRFPEIFRTATAAHQPELFVVIANWPEKRRRHWTPMLRARAIENQAYVVAVNRIGNDPFQNYAGDSMIINPQGEILAHGQNVESIVRATLDFASLRDYRQKYPFLADMR